jgi:hypothetical protein
VVNLDHDTATECQRFFVPGENFVRPGLSAELVDCRIDGVGADLRKVVAMRFGNGGSETPGLLENLSALALRIQERRPGTQRAGFAGEVFFRLVVEDGREFAHEGFQVLPGAGQPI